MAEIVTLSSPITKPSITTYRVRNLALEWGNTVEQAFISIMVVGPNNEEANFVYSGQIARTLLNQVNTMNLSTTSLQKRILQRLIADQHLSGAISGTPDAP